jgi:hypothetical protein
MKLVRTKLPSGAYKVEDVEGKRVYGVSIPAEDVEKFIKGIKANRSKKEKEADLLANIARHKKETALQMRKK